MTSYLITAYILVWPLLAAGVLYVLTVGVYRDLRDARRSGRDVV